jgi:polyvinyl alcohol dehydrogenase (cytochrome)
MHRFTVPCALALVISLLPGAGRAANPEATPGARLFRQHCAVCHEGQQPGAPAKQFLQMMSSSSVVGALTSGMMAEEGRSLTAADKEEVATYLTGGVAGGTGAAAHPAPLCRGRAARFDPGEPPVPFGWGHDNSRFTPGAVAGLPLQEVPHLKLAWALAFPGAIRARSQPAIAYGAVYVGSQDGTVYALSLKSGCVRWTYHAAAEVRTGIVLATPGDGVQGHRLFFGDLIGHVYSLDALSGRVLWRVKVARHPDATLTGTPSLQDGRLYVPVSSLEEVTAAAKPRQACCTFRGSVVALDADSGALRWRTYLIDEEPKPSGVASSGQPILAPSGAPVWNSPSVDARRGLLYVGTGDNYTGPADASSDAIVALRLSDGKLVWRRQMLKNDAWNAACMGKEGPNCPADDGPDADFGASAILEKLPTGADVVLAGQKNGVVAGIDPTDGALLWRRRVGRGGIQGGVEFGMAAAHGRLFVPIADMMDGHDGRKYTSSPHPGLYAFDAATGRPIWSDPAPDTCGSRPFCDQGITAAITVIPGVVFAGHLDGMLRAYDAGSGRVIWQFDALRKFKTVSGAVAQGGSFGGPGVVVRGGYVVVNSGYGLYFHMPGNVLLAFAPGGH